MAAEVGTGWPQAAAGLIIMQGARGTSPCQGASDIDRDSRGASLPSLFEKLASTLAGYHTVMDASAGGGLGGTLLPG